MPFIIPRRNKFVYPAGLAPGIDPFHPASGALIFSSVATVYNHISLTQGKPGVLGTGANGGTIHGIAGPGLTTLKSYTGCGTAFTNLHPAGLQSAVYPQNATVAAIVLVTGNNLNYNTIFMTDDQNKTGPGIGLSVATVNAFSFASSNIAYVEGGPFVSGNPTFVAYGFSQSAAGCHWVTCDLVTGKIASGTFTHPGSSSNVSGTGVTVGNASIAASGGFDGTTFATMYSGRRMSLNELLTWAQDPWAFWYPQRATNLTVTVAALIARAQMLTMMGVS